MSARRDLLSLYLACWIAANATLFQVLVMADCDLAGLCRRTVKDTATAKELCDKDENCVAPELPDCVAEETMVGQFGCDATDCIEVLSLAGSNDDCANLFPSLVGTSFEVRDAMHASELEDAKLKNQQATK